MNVLSVARPRYLCGIEHYGRELASALVSLGHNVRRADSPGGLKLIRRLRAPADIAIVHTEIGEDIRSGDALRLVVAATRSALPKSRLLIYLHSVFVPSDLKMRSRAGRRLACAAQYAIYRLLARSATLIVTNETAARRLSERGIKARLLPLGMYRRTSAAGADREFFASRWPHLRGRIAVGIVGHPYEAKRFDLAVRTFATLPAEMRRRSFLAITGGNQAVDERAWRSVERELTALPIDEYVVTGALDEPSFEAALDALDIVLTPYTGRSSASAVVSALAGRGVALVTSNDPAFADLARDAAAAVAETWPEQAATICATLIGDAERRETYSTRLRSLFESQSIVAVAQRLMGDAG